MFTFKYFFALLFLASLTYGQSSWERRPEAVVPVWNGNINDPSNYKTAFFPSVLYDSAKGLYRMWFMHLPWGFGVTFTIGHAISLDGIDWMVYTRNPVLQIGNPGGFESTSVNDPFVMKDGTGFRMYYVGVNGSQSAIGLATSPDGIRWTKYPGNPVLTAQPNPWESRGPAQPKVFFDGSQYKMFYTGVNASGGYEIGLATSEDGLLWQRHANNPVLRKGPSGSWDQYAVGTIAAFVGNGTYYLYYGGGPWTPIGYATSTNGVDWTRYPGNPVFFPGPSGAWDGLRVEHGSTILQGSQVKFWYSGYGYSGGLGENAWQIGYATSDFITSAPENGAELPAGYQLGQAFPNPFNPETEIGYSLPGTEHVVLKIFDSLGREVTTLVNEIKPAGTYSVRWRPEPYASGVYFYRMTAGGFSETKKVTLLK